MIRVLVRLIIFLLLLSTTSFAEDATVLTWQDCVTEAIQRNPDLAAASQVIGQKKADKWLAKSPMLPQVIASGSKNRADTFSGIAGNNKLDYSVTGEQLIFDGLKVYNDVKSAKENIKASEYNLTQTSATVRYNLRKAFAELLRAQALVPITQSIIDRRKQNYELTKLSYESGREHEGSLLLAAANLAQAEYDARAARRAISMAQYALRKSLGRDDNLPIKVKGEFKLARSIEEKPDLQNIAGDHPLVKKAEAEKDSAKFGVGSAKAGFFPKFYANAKAGKVNTGITTSDKGWLVGLNVSIPIFQGVKNVADTQKAEAKLREVTSTEKSQYDTVTSELENTWQQLKNASEDVSVQAKFLHAAEVRAKIARAQYSNGLLIFDNWIIIEDNYVNAQKKYIDVESSMLIAEANWIKAKGGPLDNE